MCVANINEEIVNFVKVGGWLAVDIILVITVIYGLALGVFTNDG